MKRKLSEEELFFTAKEEIFNISRAIKTNPNLFNSIVDSSFFWVHLNNFGDFSVAFMNRIMKEELNLVQSTNSIKLSHMLKMVDPKSTELVVPLLIDFTNKQSAFDILAFRQTLRQDIDDEFKDYYSFCSIYERDRYTITLTIQFDRLESLEEKKLFSSNALFKQYYMYFKLLTEREKEILRFIALGDTDKNISDKMFISELTVKTHRQNIKKKLETSKSSELVRIAGFFGIV